MLRRCHFAGLLIVVAGLLFAAAPVCAQVESAQATRQLITQSIDESKIVTLAGNTRPEANATNDRGAVAGDLPMEHMQLQLQLPADKEQQLEQLIQALHDPNSPNFHQWLTPDQFGQQFSVAQADVSIITAWLQGHGFTVNVIYPRSIDFSGTAAQVKAAFRTQIHDLDVNGARHIANMSDPEIPVALAPAIVGIASLNDFMPHADNRERVDYTTGSSELVVPADLATIYNFNPLFSKGVSGQGQTIVVIEDTDLYSTADWSNFRSTLGLSGYTGGSFATVHPAPPTGTNNCSDPGVNSDDGEAILDAEWSSAAAPSAAIVLASCTDTSNFGGFIALQNLLNESGTPPAIVSISYGESESELGASVNASINALYQQAVAEGVSVFVSSGDEGAASSDYNATRATHGITISGYTSTPYNVSVGGTDFGDTYTGTGGTYWSSTNNPSTYESALSYIPEIPWNDSCAGVLLAARYGYATTYGPSGFCNSSTGAGYLTTTAGSGGPSGCATGTPATSGVVGGSCAGYAKPSWQSVFGNPSDGVRDVPDVSLFAANGLWGHYYVACFSDPSNGGKSCAGAPSTWTGFGGTSISSPIMAAIQALVNQTTGSRTGNPNPTYYSLAQSEYGSGGDASCNSSLGNGAA
ncbi:MAG: protease pro-enzyme activation domain-containing protein, partial [Candidatus Acidiferrales bacterium]